MRVFRSIAVTDRHSRRRRLMSIRSLAGIRAWRMHSALSSRRHSMVIVTVPGLRKQERSTDRSQNGQRTRLGWHDGEIGWVITTSRTKGPYGTYNYSKAVEALLHFICDCCTRMKRTASITSMWLCAAYSISLLRRAWVNIRSGINTIVTLNLYNTTVSHCSGSCRSYLERINIARIKIFEIIKWQYFK